MSMIDNNKINYSNQPSFVSLLSTGLDSPIATYFFMRKGWACHSISFLNGGENTASNKEKILAVANHIVKLTHQPIWCHFINYDPFLERIQKKVDSKSTCIACKRTMYYIASQIIKESNSQFIVTGEILGEQASQTIDNLNVLNQILLEIPIVRPLIGFNKLDILQLSKKLGLYEFSLIKGEGCEFNPKYPETRAKLNKILEMESDLDRENLYSEMKKEYEFVHISP